MIAQQIIENVKIVENYENINHNNVINIQNYFYSEEINRFIENNVQKEPEKLSSYFEEIDFHEDFDLILKNIPPRFKYLNYPHKITTNFILRYKIPVNYSQFEVIKKYSNTT